MRISDWSSDVCSSDLADHGLRTLERAGVVRRETILHLRWSLALLLAGYTALALAERADDGVATVTVIGARSELQDSGVVIRVPVAPLESSSLAELLATVPGVPVRTSGDRKSTRLNASHKCAT